MKNKLLKLLKTYFILGSIFLTILLIWVLVLNNLNINSSASNRKLTPKKHSDSLIINNSGSTLNVPEKNKSIESHKIAFITQRIDLTVEEAQSFWPLYNELQKKYKLLRQKKKEVLLKIKNKQPTNHTQFSELGDELMRLNISKSKLKSEYHEKFKQILPIEKILNYYLSEYEFNMYLLKQKL